MARETCQSCHSDAYCQSCHDSLQKPLAVHPNDFLALHPVQARGNITRCESCHRLQSFCAACHERVGVGLEADPSLRARNVRVHPRLQPLGHHAGAHAPRRPASRDLKQCIACHREETCIACHADPDKGAARSYSANPHPNGFSALCKDLAARNDRACLKCHANIQLRALGCR